MFGMTAGIMLALFYCVILVVSVVTGTGGELLEDLQISPWVLATTYLLLGCVVGALLGVALPIGRTRFGAGLLGFFVGFVFYAAIGFLVMPDLSNPTVLLGSLIMLLILSVLTGVIASIFFWSEPLEP